MKARIEDGIVYSPYPEVEIFNCSFFEATKKACLTDPDKPALIDDSVTLTKSEFVARLRRYAAGLQRHGVRPGDRICVHVGNSVDNFVAMCSCLVAGASIVLAKPSLTERELRYQITDSDSTHLLVEPELAGKGLKVASELKLKGFFTTGFADGFISMEPFAELDESLFREVPVADPQECLFAIIYTSGTTGLPKGVELTHYGFLANIGMSRWTFPWDDSDVVLLPTPITHGSGILSVTISVLLGTTCVIVPPNLSLADVSRAVEQHKVQEIPYLPGSERLYCSPVALQPQTQDSHRDLQPCCCPGTSRLSSAEMRRTGQRLAGLRRVCTGGMPLSQEQYKSMHETFGEGLQVLANVYAMTEATALLCSPSREHATGVDMGFPAPADKVQGGLTCCSSETYWPHVVDRMTDKRLGPYQTGELCYKAPTVMKGYYKRPKETAEFFDEEGWCKSGDAGYYDQDGRIYFVQRFKEMIKCMDNQVVPAELEELLLRKHSADIVEVCVVGLPNPSYGEAPAAVVVTRCAEVTQDLPELSTRIKKTVTENCAVHKHLYGGVFFVDSIPKTESGKTNRPAVLKMCVA
ncbi:uncharacterized protein LOC119449043 [Dermacentor silvarum]|uniref:uncharacterized protein LOC119449043 n=1 Tax=Dermacentor silvarum TaxID=543639 RepID=UPI0021017564|nr:uncharacterized protein LOC119449043 [Dermacentor silvarum]